MKTAIAALALMLGGSGMTSQRQAIYEIEPGSNLVRVITNATESGFPDVTQYETVQIIGRHNGSDTLLGTISYVRGKLHLDVRSSEGATTVVLENGAVLVEEDGPPD